MVIVEAAWGRESGPRRIYDSNTRIEDRGGRRNSKKRRLDF